MGEPNRDAEESLVVGDVDRGLPPTHAAERRLLIQEVARLGFGAAGMVLLFFVVIVSFLRATTWEETRTLLDIFVPVVGAFVGAAAGLAHGHFW